jgi:hypothetical protein
MKDDEESNYYDADLLISSVNRFIKSNKSDLLNNEQTKTKIDKFKSKIKEFGKEEEKHFWKNIGKVCSLFRLIKGVRTRKS